ncbi:MAG: hemolysin activation/secretion protein [Paraglaciecola sp.]|jgi:hemolysin activation/secretion protein
MPNAIGGNNGVRGYPLQYQHGEQSALLSAETRYYPNLNLYKLFDVGFVDAGKARSGNFAALNESNSIIASVGLGARIYSSRSSYRNVVHIDIAKPMTNSIHIDSWEWRLQVKHSF